jgi:single-stranded-DNA-specific exonuclease
LIISDHHHPGEELPQAVAIINPKQAGDGYPDKNLAGVGLAYKLAEGLWQKISEGASEKTIKGQKPATFLDLVALGTITDLAPLTGENRSLVREGLQAIRSLKRPGIAALVGVAELVAANITATEISFMLGPRLNAAGRLETALDAYQLLVSANRQEAGLLAQKLENQNRDRQEITRQMQSRAEELALGGVADPLLLLAIDPEFNPGVVGLVASRLTEMHYRPSMVAFRGEEFTRGSCRSIPEFHITEALDQCAELLEHHGGHAAAAGFTVKNQNLPEFIERIQRIAGEQLANRELQPTLVADLVISLSDLKPEILDYLSWLQPTGYGNPQAVFVSQGLKVSRSRTVGKDNAHLKLSVTDGRITYDAIAFRQGDWQDKLPGKVDLIYTFERNDFNGQAGLQLNVRDIRPA